MSFQRSGIAGPAHTEELNQLSNHQPPSSPHQISLTMRRQDDHGFPNTIGPSAESAWLQSGLV